MRGRDETTETPGETSTQNRKEGKHAHNSMLTD